MDVRGRKQVARWGLYLRISSYDGDGQSPGTQRQEKDCRAAVAVRGGEVVHVYLDDDTSAWSLRKPRKDYLRMLDDLKNGVIDGAMAWHEDRLLRRNRELEDLIELVEATGVVIATVNGDLLNLANDDLQFKARITVSVANKESADKSRRLRRMHEAKGEDGEPNGGRRPTGYHADRITPAKPETFPCEHANADKCTARPGEAAMVAELIDRVAAGQTLTAIAKDFNARGLATSAGSPWTIWTVRRVALNPRYAGLRVHRGTVVGAAAWPGLVDESTWRRAVAILNDPSRVQRRTARRYLLSGGLLVCGKCLAEDRVIAMRSKQHHTRAGKVPTYTCPPSTQGGCGGTSVRADAVEELVGDAVVAYVESPKYGRKLRARKGGDRKAAAAVERIRAQLAQNENDRATGVVTQREYVKFRDGDLARLAEAQGRMAEDTTDSAVGRFAGQPGALRALWEDPATTLDRRQAIVRAVVDRVVIAPVGKATRKRFNPDRVHIDWL